MVTYVCTMSLEILGLYSLQIDYLIFKPFPPKSLFLYKTFRNEGKTDALYPIPMVNSGHVGQFGKTGWSTLIP